jgi:sortase (surface protein transpeptidase)
MPNDAPSDPAESGIPGPGPTQTRSGSIGPVLAASPPAFLSVPAIGINSPLIELGRNPDGSVEVPSLDDPDSEPGWYRNSPTPGAIGPAIILGHVDSRQFGPGVFYALQDLSSGDAVEVTRADGTVAIFSVNDVHIVPKSDFPTLQVYGNLDYAGLRLITCGGEFDPNARSYASNVIVFAKLVGSRPA